MLLVSFSGLFGGADAFSFNAAETNGQNSRTKSEAGSRTNGLAVAIGSGDGVVITRHSISKLGTSAQSKFYHYLVKTLLSFHFIDHLELLASSC